MKSAFAALFAYEYRDNQDLTADERSFSSASSDFFLPELFDLAPSSDAQNVLINFGQDLTPRLTLSGYGMYGVNDSFNSRPIDPDDGQRSNLAESEQSTIALALAYDLTDKIVLEVGGSYSLSDVEFTLSEPAIDRLSITNTEDEAFSFDARASGDLVNLPGGAVKLALGGECREHESTRDASGDTSNINDRTQQRDIVSGFVEFIVPVFGPGNRRPLFESVQLSLAGRYDDFSDAGSMFTPQVGLSWLPTDDLSLRSSWGESFKAPRFAEQTGSTTVGLITSSDPAAEDGRTPYILLFGSPPPGVLEPETAETLIRVRPRTPDGEYCVHSRPLPH